MVLYETITQLYVVITQQMLHPNARDATKNNSIIYNTLFPMEQLYMLLLKLKLYIRHFIFIGIVTLALRTILFATKSLLAATIDVFVPQCLLNSRDSWHNLRESSSFVS